MTTAAVEAAAPVANSELQGVVLQASDTPCYAGLPPPRRPTTNGHHHNINSRRLKMNDKSTPTINRSYPTVVMPPTRKWESMCRGEPRGDANPLQNGAIVLGDTFHPHLCFETGEGKLKPAFLFLSWFLPSAGFESPPPSPFLGDCPLRPSLLWSRFAVRKASGGWCKRKRNALVGALACVRGIRLRPVGAKKKKKMRKRISPR